MHPSAAVAAPVPVGAPQISFSTYQFPFHPLVAVPELAFRINCMLRPEAAARHHVQQSISNAEAQDLSKIHGSCLVSRGDDAGDRRVAPSAACASGDAEHAAHA